MKDDTNQTNPRSANLTNPNKLDAFEFNTSLHPALFVMVQSLSVKSLCSPNSCLINNQIKNRPVAFVKNNGRLLIAGLLRSNVAKSIKAIVIIKRDRKSTRLNS